MIRFPGGTELRLEPGFGITLGILLLLCGSRWSAAVLSVSAVHEAGHLAAMRAFGIRVRRVSLGFGGAEIVPDREVSKVKELVCVLSGPAAGMLPAVLSYPAAASGFFSCVFWSAAALTVWNLLPIVPLDGGRALFLLLSVLLPERTARRAVLWTGRCFTAAILGAAVFAAVRARSYLLLPAAFSLAICSCHAGKTGVEYT